MMTPSRAEPDLSTYAGRFGAHIRAIREKMKLTQQEVADACDVKDATIGHWELGRYFPSVEKLPLLAEVLKQKKVGNLFPEK